ncbi:hypothetical protein FB192DRAFT_1391652 [Mucor lusitanicus]|uniref:Zinc finger PHD-type domain-containing protein n=1 Tax=Mucor circinelloides f. lusitanicus TaxID=29924 RepID=A0A8H4EYQ7_MUCCL|nr:hypothetical protein FB192DRAFT_1391652 [Mucor lusitanicus]
MVNLPICYRCREIINDTTEPINCCQCYKYWHASCLIYPVDTHSLKDWKCPQHDGRSHTRKHKLVKKDGNVVKVALPEEDLTFPEADKIVDYGGVVYNVKASDIENEFLNYARRYRFYRLLHTQQDHFKSDASEWLESLQAFSFQDIPQFQNDGIQMLLDAANMDDTLSISTHSSTVPEEEEDVAINNVEDTKYQAIEELIRLKGQDELMKLLN